MNISTRLSSSSLPRVRIDLRDLHRLDFSRGYHLETRDDFAHQEDLKKILFVPCAQATINNEVHRVLVLSDGVVSMSADPRLYETSLSKQLRELGRVHCAVMVMTGDCLIQFKDKEQVLPVTTAAPLVSFWLGYLTASLGRNNVIVLHEDGPYFKCPTHYFEAIYIPFDPQGVWKAVLRAHLKKLNIHVNENVSAATFFSNKDTVYA